MDKIPWPPWHSLKKRYGGRWTALRISHEPEGECVPDAPKLRLCEAVVQSMKHPLTLHADQIVCEGARRSLGIVRNDETLAENISEKTGMAFLMALAGIRAVPRLDNAVRVISLGKQTSPDMLIGLLRPDHAMLLMRQWQTLHPASSRADLSTFSSICGGIVAGTLTKNTLCCSLGCPSSRSDGLIRSAEIAVGILFSTHTTITMEKTS